MILANQPYLMKLDLLKSIASGKLQSNNIAKSQRVNPWVSGSVGVVPISGPLTIDNSILSMIFSGGMNYQSIRDNIQNFLDDEKISAILLDINSPGGDAAGVSELAEFIHNSPKPVLSYVAGDAASAAYWLATATKKIITNKTAFVGSIGVALMVDNEQGKVFVSDKSPKKIPDHTTDNGAAQLRHHLNTLAEYFIGDVSTYRGVDKSVVESDFGQGDMVAASDALKLGMIDNIGNFQTALDAAVNYNASPKPKKEENKKILKNKRFKFMSKFKTELVFVDSEQVPEGVQMQEVTIDTIKQLFPEIAEELINLGKSEYQKETDDVVESAKNADMTDEEEKAMVALAMSRKITAQELTNRLLAHKTKKLGDFKTKSNLSGFDQPKIAVAGGGSEPNVNTKSDRFLTSFKKIRGTK